MCQTNYLITGNTQSVCSAPTEIMFAFKAILISEGQCLVSVDVVVCMPAAPPPPLLTTTHPHTHLSPSVLLQCQDIEQPCTCVLLHSHI